MEMFNIYLSVSLSLLLFYELDFTFGKTNQPFHYSGPFLCRRCGANITHGEYSINVPSPGAIKSTWHKAPLGRKGNILMQTFVNPYKHKFDVLTFTSANVEVNEEAYPADTWFEGFSWMLCSCPRCQAHMGWKYRPTNFNHLTSDKSKIFFGLVSAYLLEEEEANSIVLTPSIFQS